jgi:hypothetical protein
VIRPTVYDAMADGDGLREVQLLQGGEGRLHRRLMLRKITVHIYQDFFRTTDPEVPALQADALGCPFSEQRFFFIP